MKKACLFLFFFWFALNLFVFSQEEDFRDPLTSLLPQDESVIEEGEIAVEEKREPLEITLQGVIWNTKMPQVIIDGKVYIEGDTIQGIDGKILKINDGIVSIFYDGAVYEERIKSVEKK